MSGARKRRLGRTLISFGFVFLLSLFLKNAELAIIQVKEGIRLSLESVIPSLFPFMIISELIVKCGIADVLSKPLARIANLLFGISGKGATVFFIGAICGFPLGARSAVQLYDNGEIDKKELSALMDFSNNPSSAFVISAVGVSLFGSRRLGALLYLTTIMSAVSIGVIRGFSLRKREGRLDTNKPILRGLALKDFTEAVTGSALGVINVCAFVTFFSVVSGAVGAALEALRAPATIRAVFFSLLEMTSGAAASAGVGGRLGVLIVAFCLGWSGLSVHCQVLSLCGERIRAARYLASKFIQGMLGVIYTWIFMLLLGEKIFEGKESVVAVKLAFFEEARLFILILFALSLLLCLVNKKIPRKKRGIGFLFE